MADVGVVRLPFRRSGAVDGRDGELARLEVVRRGDGEALCYVSGHGGDVCDLPVWNGDGAVGGEHVGCWVVVIVVGVSDLDGDGGGGEGHVGGDVGVWKAGEGCGSLVCYCGDGPALPVEGAVFEVRDLWGKGGVDDEGVRRVEAETEVAKDGDLICAAVACEEGIGGVGAAVEGEVVDELFGELEPGCAGVRLFRVLLVGVGGAARGFDSAGDDAEDGIGHARAVEGLFAGVVVEVVERVLCCVIYLVIQGEGI